jgi:hypothetical protein
MIHGLSAGRKGCSLVLRLVICASIPAIGCSKPTGTVKGKVTDKEGNPVPVGVIGFTVGSRTQSGPIGLDGSFSVTGVPVGEAKVTVSSPQPTVPTETLGFEPSAEKMKGMPKEQIDQMKASRKRLKEILKKWFAIVGRYNAVADTPLTFEVKQGDNSADFKVDRRK